MSTTANCARMLCAAALGVTRPLLRVLTAVPAHSHADTGSRIGVVRRQFPGVSQVSVYDVQCALMTEAF